MIPMSEFAQHLMDVFRLFGQIEVKRMFGGHGVFREGRMFALAVDETLYLKADAENVAHFHRLGLTPFEYRRKGKPTKLSYYLAPDAVLEDCSAAAHWAQRSYEAALRSDAGKRRKRT